MRIRPISRLILLIILCLTLGFCFVEQFKATVTLRASYSNGTEIVSRNSLQSGEVKTNQNLTKIVVSSTVSPFPFKFLLNPKDLCSRGAQTESQLSLIILVFTSTSHNKQREAIRNTWGSVASANNNTEDVRLAFLLGVTADGSLQREIQEEAAKHSDIIQQDFIDSYRNLTFKSVMLLKWVSEYCPNVHFVLKIDDDMYANVPNLLKTLARLPVKSNVIYGQLMHLYAPHRNPSSKWFVSKTEFGGDMYPDFVSGTAYVMSRDVTPKLLEASTTIPFLFLEDVFITGLCASQCHVQRLDIKGFAKSKRPAEGCAYIDAITGHFVTPKDMIKIWMELQKKPLICPYKIKYRKKDLGYFRKMSHFPGF